MLSKIAASMAVLNIHKTFGTARIIYALVTYAILVTLSFILPGKYVIVMWIAWFIFDFGSKIVYEKYFINNYKTENLQIDVRKNECKKNKKHKK